MTEKEKMFAGKLYDCGDAEISSLNAQGKNLMREFNQLDYTDQTGRERILEKLLGSKGQKTTIIPPFYVDFGKFIHVGSQTEINMNCVFLDCNIIKIGDYCLIAPGVHIYTAHHPVTAEERFPADSDAQFSTSYASPVTIGNHVWIGGGTIILPGVTIGDYVTIGAGGVVAQSIPDHSLAVGNPCRVIRKI